MKKARTNLYDIDTVKFAGQQLWQTVTKEIEEFQTLGIFKGNIKSITLDCSCTLCKTFIVTLGF